MSEKISQKQFRQLTQAWTMNNGILGFIDYFFYPHNRSAFYDTPEEMLTAYHDRDKEQPEYQWSIDDYVNEWWGYWQMGLAFVYNRSDGSILDWLHHIIDEGVVV
tara:strand:+ start:221 stop:535 length:315 start_codon:yes stop_codon:yes gene_type:complete